MKMTKVKRSVFMPEALSKPVPGTAPPTEVDRLMRVICDWADVDPSSLSANGDPLSLPGNGPEAAERWSFVAQFLAFNLLPCFSAIRDYRGMKAGRQRRNNNVLNPSYGSPLTREESEWLVRTIDEIKSKKGHSMAEACEELKTTHRNRDLVAQRGSATLSRLYYEERARLRRKSLFVNARRDSKHKS